MRIAMTAPAVGSTSCSWLLQVLGPHRPHIYCPTLHLGVYLFPLIPAHLPHHLTKPNPTSTYPEMRFSVALPIAVLAGSAYAVGLHARQGM